MSRTRPAPPSTRANGHGLRALLFSRSCGPSGNGPPISAAAAPCAKPASRRPHVIHLPGHCRVPVVCRHPASASQPPVSFCITAAIRCTLFCRPSVVAGASPENTWFVIPPGNHQPLVVHIPGRVAAGADRNGTRVKLRRGCCTASPPYRVAGSRTACHR